MTILDTSHPIYSPTDGTDPNGDRCVCGGIRYWHAVDPHGCDDCDCTSFRLRTDRAVNDGAS